MTHVTNGERVQRYAEAIDAVLADEMLTRNVTRAVLEVADAEQADIWEGADATPVPEERWPLPGQVWHQLLTMSPADRADHLFRIFDALSVRERMQRALEEAHAANARMASENAERMHRAIEREEALKMRLEWAEGRAAKAERFM